MADAVITVARITAPVHRGSLLEEPQTHPITTSIIQMLRHVTESPHFALLTHSDARLIAASQILATSTATPTLFPCGSATSSDRHRSPSSSRRAVRSTCSSPRDLLFPCGSLLSVRPTRYFGICLNLTDFGFQRWIYVAGTVSARRLINHLSYLHYSASSITAEYDSRARHAGTSALASANASRGV